MLAALHTQTGSEDCDDDDDNDDGLMGLDCDLFAADNDRCGRLDDQRRRAVAASREWGIPGFEEQCNGMNTFHLYPLHQDQISASQGVTVRLEHRKHSTGSDLWDASLVVAYALDRPGVYMDTVPSCPSRLFHNCTILELGSGTGALGLYCSQCLGASHVILTDLPANLELLETNRHLNQISNSKVSIEALDWTLNLPDSIRRQSIDLVIGSDLFLPFAKTLLDPLARTIRDVLSLNPRGQALIAYEERFECQPFFEHAATYGLSVSQVSNHILHPKYQDPKRIHLLRIRLCDNDFGETT